MKSATSILDYIFRELGVSYLGRNDLAHANPDDMRPDALGDGADESDLGRVASKGYVRGQFLVLRLGNQH